jgi:hypothetical protein
VIRNRECQIVKSCMFHEFRSERSVFVVFLVTVHFIELAKNYIDWGLKNLRNESIGMTSLYT